jgi:hypothetical protein
MTKSEYNLKHLQWFEPLKSSRAISHVRELKLADVSGTFSVPILNVSDVTTAADLPTYIPAHGLRSALSAQANGG